MSNLILTEAAKSERKYKCPFCDYRNTKSKLVDHIDKKHKELIPKDYTAARIVFNMINKKDHGTCVCGCGRETAWREDVWRYDRYATPQCKEKYSAEMKQRMIRVYGKEHLLNDPEMQEKMLNNRSISGTYKFTHGGEVSYVGSYEMKLLEFLDKVMGYKAIDVQSPGPTIEYMYNGKKHFWITDQYLIPYNLVFDCKDGGDNPNNREMKEYREKQIAKEEAIRKQGKYNYIRLTNNNFAQLMLVLAELKERMLDIVEDEDPIIRIFESAAINEGSTVTDLIKSIIFPDLYHSKSIDKIMDKGFKEINNVDINIASTINKILPKPKKNKKSKSSNEKTDYIISYNVKKYDSIFNKDEYDEYCNKIKKICNIIKKNYDKISKSYNDIKNVVSNFNNEISFGDSISGNTHKISLYASPYIANLRVIKGDTNTLEDNVNKSIKLFNEVVKASKNECNKIDNKINIECDFSGWDGIIMVSYRKTITVSNESAAINEGSSYSKYPTDKLEDLYKKKYREYSYVKNYSFSNSDSATDRADEIGTMKEELDKIKKELDKRKNNKKKSIEELCSAVMGALVDTNELYGVSYIRNNSFTPEYGITDDINMDYVLTTDDIGNIFGKGKDFFNNECESYRIFKYNKPVLKNKINFEASNLLEVVTGKKILHPEQLLYDTDFEQVLSENILTSIIESSYEATMKKTDYKIPIINKDYILDEFVMFYKDSNGYFVENTLNNLRSKSYPSLESIDKFTIDYISKGKLFG